MSNSFHHRSTSGNRRAANGLLNLIMLASPNPKGAKRLKVKDKASKDKSTNSIAITPDSLRINKTLLIGKKLKKYFAGFGGAIGTVTKYTGPCTTLIMTLINSNTAMDT